MARNRRGRPVNGWVVIDKPAGITSTRAVNVVRRVFDAAKAGHAGTLDPFATGILPIALGEATKTVPYVMGRRKSYRFEIRWGEERDTDDCEGTVTGTSAVRPDREVIEQALDAFRGQIEQVPPRYSAVRIGGRRAYDLARNDEDVTLPPRPVRIDEFMLEEIPDPDRAIFRVTSGKGAYMRALARDLARNVGTVGHLARLARLSVGNFDAETAVPLDFLETRVHSPAAFDHLLPVDAALDDIPALDVTGDEADRLRRGQRVPLFRASDRARRGELREGDLLYARCSGLPVAVSRIREGCISPVRVLNL